ncbi:MAG: ATP-binding protein [Arcobacter sp.]|uniref:ATP-binding protein n=1 Tax=Arcobacter sp. TaxID=1872629 RepID=UPI003AFF972A
MSNFSIKIKTSILTIFSIVIFLIITTILYIQHQSSTEFVHLTTQKSFDNISEKVINKIEQFDISSDNFITFLKNSEGIEKLPTKNVRHDFLKVITEYIKSSNYTYGIYIGFKDDSFFQVINLEVSNNIKEILKAPTKARWLIRKHINENGKIIRYEELLDKNLIQINQSSKEVNYRPTQRPWYIQAKNSSNTIKTTPYIFTSLQEPGVTYAKSVNNKSQVVIGLDISLSSLEKLLSEQKLVLGSGAYIFTEDGTIIGQYDTDEKKDIKNIKDKYENTFIKNETISNLGKITTTYINKQKYIKYVVKLQTKFDHNEYITIFSPLKTIMKPYMKKIYDTLGFTLLIIILFILPIVFFATRLIVKPILKLEVENKKIAEGKFKDVVNVKSFMIEINSLSESLVNMSKSIEENQRVLEIKVQERTQDIQNLLNNAGQGFLSFDKNMIIADKYSIEAKNIFQQEIKTLNITKLLYEDIDKQNFLKNTLQNILNEDEMKQEILISLLQKEFLINNRNISAEYKILDNSNYMLILTDITAEKELARQVKEEEQILKMIVETVRSSEQFFEIKNDYEDFVSKINNFNSLETLSSLRNDIHTFKGLFAQKEMFHIVEKLHDFESAIDESIQNNSINKNISNISKESMIKWLEEDLNILKDILGEDYFENKNSILIDKKRIIEIENKLKLYIKENRDLNEIFEDIKKLRYHDISIFLKPYEKLVEQLAFDLEKCIEPLNIICEKIFVPDSFKPFLNSLVHIFRNSVDHGIETLEERCEKEKNEYGKISCKVELKNKNLSITIEDDGKGIDIQKVKQAAIDKEIYTIGELNKMNNKEISMIIFEDRFTTSDTISNISGRGVGLASILEELKKLDGSINLENNIGQGIKFIFKIPFKEL